MTELPHVFVLLRGSVDGTACAGLASEGLPPKWFTKDPDTRFEEDLPEMVRVIRHAADLVAGSGARFGVRALAPVARGAGGLGRPAGDPSAAGPPRNQPGGTGGDRCLLPRERDHVRARGSREPARRRARRDPSGTGRKPTGRLASRAAPLGRRPPHRRFGRSPAARPDRSRGARRRRAAPRPRRRRGGVRADALQDQGVRAAGGRHPALARGGRGAGGHLSRIPLHPGRQRTVRRRRHLPRALGRRIRARQRCGPCSTAAGFSSWSSPCTATSR